MIATTTRAEMLDALPWNVVNVPAGATTDVLVDRSVTPAKNNDIVAYRFIQNLTGADLYFSMGMDTDAAANQFSYHGVLQDKQQLAIATNRRVSVWSAAGGRVATLELTKPGV